jgi:hypothetical protein
MQMKHRPRPYTLAPESVELETSLADATQLILGKPLVLFCARVTEPKLNCGEQAIDNHAADTCWEF